MKSENTIQRVYWADGEKETYLLDFLDSQLRPGAGYSIRDEYPSVFRAQPGGESLFIEQKGEVVSHVAFLAREYRHPLFQMKTGLLGSIVTDPRFRGHGYATRLIKDSLDELRKRGCVIAVLWSDKPEFYEPMGFYRAGRELDLLLDVSPKEIPGPAPIPFNPAVHSSGLLQWYRQHPGGLDRTQAEQEKLSIIPRSRIYVTERAGKVTSYLAIQKGADFENYIHEWGGEMSELRRNVAWVQGHVFPNTPLVMIAPSYYDLMPLAELATVQKAGVLGLIKILDLGALWKIYSTYLKTLSVPTEWDKKRGVFHVGDEEIPVAREDEVLRLIFGDESSPSHPVLPFFLWGFDSV